MRREWNRVSSQIIHEFQYRKRYEVTCDQSAKKLRAGLRVVFQYRKRYEVTCDRQPIIDPEGQLEVSIPQAV